MVLSTKNNLYTIHIKSVGSEQMQRTILRITLQNEDLNFPLFYSNRQKCFIVLICSIYDLETDSITFLPIYILCHLTSEEIGL